MRFMRLPLAHNLLLPVRDKFIREAGMFPLCPLKTR